MCQATVYLVADGERQEIMREVISLVRIPGGVELRTFFEEPRTVPGQVVEIDFLKHVVTLAPPEPER